MKHKKKEHKEKVDICWKYARGKCDFEEQNCWFLHQDQNGVDFECTNCDKTFAANTKLLQHRKKDHRDSVPSCKNEKSGTCKYGNANCWFNHDENEDISKKENNEKQNENKEVIEKIFQMMEKYTQQIVNMKEMDDLK